jgi:hypothetical protein
MRNSSLRRRIAACALLLGTRATTSPVNLAYLAGLYDRDLLFA